MDTFPELLMNCDVKKNVLNLCFILGLKNIWYLCSIDFDRESNSGSL